MRKVVPIVLILAGVVMFGVGLAFAINSVGSTVGSITSTTMIGSPFTAPGSDASDLQPGTYTVYENIGFAGSQPGNLTVDPDSITVTDNAAKDWTFAVDKDTAVFARGGSHKMDQLTADGKPTVITEFVAVKKNVVVKYVEKDGKAIAKEVHVK